MLVNQIVYGTNTVQKVLFNFCMLYFRCLESKWCLFSETEKRGDYYLVHFNNDIHSPEPFSECDKLN